MGATIARLAVLGAAVLAGCAPASQTSDQSAHHSPPAVGAVVPETVPGSPSAAPIPTPVPTLTTRVGAVASPSGFLALAVIDNGSLEDAINVRIQISALDASGRLLMRRQGSIARVGSQRQAAIALTFPVPAVLPSRFVGAVTAVDWRAPTADDAVQVSSSTLVENAQTPSVLLHLIKSGHAAARVTLTAICWDAAGNIRGGGSRALTIGPDSNTRDVSVSVSISAVPSRCDAYSVTDT